MPAVAVPRTAPSGLVAGTILAGRYRIVGLLGKGGMGEVYRAEDLKLGQTVALKFLPAALARDGAALARFHREVRVARQVSHPNVCRVFDIGETEGRHFLSMEYIDGEDLASLLRRIGRLPVDKGVEIARQLCVGLAAAHENGVLHRDLKPANVMLDGRGRVRITDFGLASLSEELRADDIRSGTPAYMSPEQLAGRECTVRSDLYAVGLILYEVFTGKRAFEAAQGLERETSSVTNPSTLVRDLDPLVERVILRCLEHDPASRPPTAMQIAAALPGGDPLAAALAAGETPSPEMVAAAHKEGALAPRVSIAALAGLVAGCLLLVALSGRFALHQAVPLDKSPEVLAERASQILERAGYPGRPAGKAYRYQIDRTYLLLGQPKERNFAEVRTGQPLTYFFWYRQSPRPIEPARFVTIGIDDPPAMTPGEVRVITDVRGRLVDFRIIPLAETARASPVPVSWTSLLADAGVRPESLQPAKPEWMPPIFADARAAWTGQHPDHPGIPIRIEAASLAGRPVFFRVVMPWDRQDVPPRNTTGRERLAIASAVLLFCSLLVAATILARRNYLLGRGDAGGAAKVAAFAGAAEALAEGIAADHVPALFAELWVLFQILGTSLVVAAGVWVFYLALEPYARRFFPYSLVSWTRLLAGDFRNPLVGRDVLLGGLMGFGHALTIACGSLAGQAVTPALGPLPVVSSAFDTASQWLGSRVGSLVPSVTLALTFLFFLVICYALFRRQGPAVLSLWATIAVIDALAFGRAWPLIVASLISAALGTLVVWRLGLLAAVAGNVFFHMSFHSPLTADLTVFYAGRMLAAFGVMVALAAFACSTSMGGRGISGDPAGKVSSRREA